MTSAARRFKRQANKALDELERQGVLTEALLQGFRGKYLCVYCVTYLERACSRDLDNCLKIAQDVLCKRIGIDDKKVVDIHLTERVDREHPRLYLEVEAVSSWTFGEEQERQYVVLRV